MERKKPSFIKPPKPRTAFHEKVAEKEAVKPTQPISKPKPKKRKKISKLSLVLTEEQYREIETLSRAEDRSMSKFVVLHLKSTGVLGGKNV